MELVCGLCLDDQIIVYDHVKPLKGQLFALVHDTNASLSTYLMAAASQFPLESHDIDALEEPKAECVVNFIESV